MFLEVSVHLPTGGGVWGGHMLTGSCVTGSCPGGGGYPNQVTLPSLPPHLLARSGLGVGGYGGRWTVLPRNGNARLSYLRKASVTSLTEQNGG